MSTHLKTEGPLSVREREHIRNRMRMNERALAGQISIPTNKAIGPEGMSERREGYYSQFMRDDINEDSALLRFKIEKDKRILEAGDPKNISRKDRTKIERQVQVDSEWVKGQMCPKTLFHKNRQDPDFDKAVKACDREHTEEYKRVAGRLKANMRRLDPDGESNLERLRPNS